MSAATWQVDDGSVEMTIGPDDAATLITADDDPCRPERVRRRRSVSDREPDRATEDAAPPGAVGWGRSPACWC